MTTLLDQIDADLDTFMDSESGFAEEFTFTGTFGPYIINGIFDEGATVVNDFTGGVDVQPHRLTVKTADLQPVKPHDTIRKGMVTYEILEINPDGYGMTGLILVKVRED